MIVVNHDHNNAGKNGNRNIAAVLGLPGVKQEKDYTGILKANQVTINDLIELPPVCIEIGPNGNYSTIATLGNISLIMAKAKQGKTFAVTILLSAIVNNASFQGLIRASLPVNQPKAILFDTEQSKYHVQRVLKRICHLSGIQQPTNLLVYSLRGLTPAERLESIEYAIYNTPNLGFVVIDGIRDLISSINDEEQSTMITSKLLKWTEDLHIHIMTVLHQNKGDYNARGHLGTELTNKCETVLSVTKAPDNKEVSVVQPEYCRDREFEPFAFKIDEHGIPAIINDWTLSKDTGSASKKIIPPHDVDPATHFVLLKDIFKVQNEMRYSDLKTSAKSNLDRWLSVDLGKLKVEGWISYWKQFEFITISGTPGTISARYTLNSSKKLN